MKFSEIYICHTLISLLVASSNSLSRWSTPNRRTGFCLLGNFEGRRHHRAAGRRCSKTAMMPIVRLAKTAPGYSSKQKVMRPHKNHQSYLLVGPTPWRGGKSFLLSHDVTCWDNRKGLTGFGCRSSTVRAVANPSTCGGTMVAMLWKSDCNQHGPSILIVWKCVPRNTEEKKNIHTHFHPPSIW